MNKITGITAGTILCASLFWGCSASTGQIVDANYYKGKQRCARLDKDLIKVDRYIEVVSHTDAFHLQEAAQAIQEPDISISTNKKDMLRDANNLRNSLDAERKKLGCQ